MKQFYCFRPVQTIIIASLLLLGTLQKSMAQCTSAIPGMTVNGVAITGGGDFIVEGGIQTGCNHTTPENSLRAPEFVYTSSQEIFFSKPVNNLRMIITGAFYYNHNQVRQRIEFTSNNGPVNINLLDGCRALRILNVTPNIIYTNSSSPNSLPRGAEFIISVPGGFTHLSIMNLNRARPRFAICAESVIAVPELPTLSKVVQPTCENKTASYTITNFNAGNTYTISPAENTYISSTGVMTVPAAGRYSLISSNPAGTSDIVTVNAPDYICAQPDAYTVEVNQTLTENLKVNDGYIPPRDTSFIPRPDPAFTNASTCVPLVVNETSPEQKTLTFTCNTVGVYHFLVPVSGGGSTIRVPLTITVNSSLPVTLVSFNAKQEGQLVNLEWETTEETNSDRFEIEWKTTGEWKKIGSVTAATESNELKGYTFQHNEPAAGQNLYRLKMIDSDGTFTFSTIRNVDFESRESNAVYPNPVTNGKLRLADWTNVKSVEIYNQQGKKLKTFNSLIREEMDVSSLPNGLYVVKAIRASGTFLSEQIIINN